MLLKHALQAFQNNQDTYEAGRRKMLRHNLIKQMFAFYGKSN